MDSLFSALSLPFLLVLSVLMVFSGTQIYCMLSSPFSPLLLFLFRPVFATDYLLIHWMVWTGVPALLVHHISSVDPHQNIVPTSKPMK